MSADFPAAGPRKPDAAGIAEQAVSPAGQRKPHGRLQRPQGDGARRQPALGRPAEEGGGHPPPAQGPPALTCLMYNLQGKKPFEMTPGFMKNCVMERDPFVI